MDYIGEAVGNMIFGEQGTKGEWEKTHRYNSFASERENCHVKWYVDGKSYFYAVSEALMAAKEEIFIEDWWLSPELYLRRPPSKNEDYRLDLLLKKKAEEGVKIYVVIYKEMPKTLTLNSRHSKDILQNLHENIVVQRHPDHGLDGTFFWAHHEKMVVIDRHISFIGGLDLCFGRYDTPTHQLADFHEASKKYSIWPGQDYSNPRIMDFTDVQNWAKGLIDKKKTPRMPWHDVSIGFVGRPALDVARHFIQRWNFIKKQKAQDRPVYPVLIAKSDEQHDRELPPKVRSYSYCGENFECHPDKGSCNVQILRSSAEWSHGLDKVDHSIQNAYIKIIEAAQHFIYIENQFFITATKESKDYPVKNLIGKAIVERITRAFKNNEKFRIIVAMPLLPAFPADLDSGDAGTVRLVMHYQYQSICRGGQSIYEVLRKNGVTNPDRYIGFYALRAHDKINPQSIAEGLGLLEDEINASGTAEQSGADPAVPQAVVDEDPSGTYITEELYIHTKLLIADDRIVICGSANLNDRSQNGDHDSEIAAVIEDKNYIDSKMVGKEWQAGKFAATLRRHIFKEHLGLLNETDHEKITPICHPPPLNADLPLDDEELSQADHVVIDPASEEFYYNVWHRTATINTEAFRTVFRSVPDDSVTTWKEFKAFVPDRTKIPTGHICDPEKLPRDVVESELSKVKGHLVHFPLQFMSNETLSGSVVIDAVTPMELFT
ncbi:1911_t:CDS:10 [Funneliformis geosporum]|uniref:phospholipase D n=1 Tax=Funneliformis geosporum TaxID=1117311 RepID=A0A9W4X204_9GLOM|nr:1911_t:CDS:10 [Funneliformis geosporum]CAI2180611.1 13960_t:CDS:10 [Funneliformis geosporum]